MRNLSAADSASRAAAIRANQEFHTLLAPTYESDEPHNRPENKVKVRNRLLGLLSKVDRPETVVDFGCGTGFILELLPDWIKLAIGIDTTPAMLKILRAKSLPRVEILERSVYDTGLSSDSADLVTGYSVLDHFADPQASLREAHRILKPGGYLYMDLIPNGNFWTQLRTLGTDASQFHPLVGREIDEVVNHATKMFTKFGVSQQLLAAAEPHKETSDGFTEPQLVEALLDTGFQHVSIHHEWFLGEGHVMHMQSASESATIANHLARLLPLSSHLFKYLWFEATK
jgi:ubiquinone/menaquinone biosynthesis C-methylase UbiE